MEEEEESSSGGIEWTGTFDQYTYELKNTADNTEYGYDGDESFELLDFKSEINVKYEQPEGVPSTFQPDYEESTVNVTGTFPLNLNYNIDIDSSSGIKITIEGDLEFLKEYAEPFFLPDSFSFDLYDSPSGYYESGYPLKTAGGNYNQIIPPSYPQSYESKFNVSVSIPNPSESEVKEATQEFKIKINRSYTASRNQFISGYLEEQIKRGDVEYFTYNGKKFTNGGDYIRELASNVQPTKGVDVTLQSIDGSIESNPFSIGMYFYNDNSNADVYSFGSTFSGVDDNNQSVILISLSLKNVVGVFNVGDIVYSGDFKYLVKSVGSEKFFDEPKFGIVY